MKSILVFGAGRSSLYLLEYLQKWCITNTAQLIVCDKDTSFAAQHIAEKTAITFQEIDVFDIEKNATKIQESILV
ncbi:MAG: saccharopine dehydrogenase, partial [Bacteroidetes bacterium]|nr:saccharopine dehydrogenase [Bacteroidota bacterium]